MAGFLPQGSSRTIQILGPSQVADVERVEAITTPSGVYFWRYVPLATFLALGSDSWMQELAQAIEDRIASGLADTAAMIEDTDASGLIVDLVQFVISVPAGPGKLGPFTTTVDVPVNLLTSDSAFVGDLVSPLFEDALAALHKIAD